MRFYPLSYSILTTSVLGTTLGELTIGTKIRITKKVQITGIYSIFIDQFIFTKKTIMQFDMVAFPSLVVFKFMSNIVDYRMCLHV